MTDNIQSRISPEDQLTKSSQHGAQRILPRSMGFFDFIKEGNYFNLLPLVFLMRTKTPKPPVDRKKAALNFIIAALLLLVLFPIMVFIHEMGHVIAILLMGGEVSGLEMTWLSGSVSFSGIESSRDLFLVHLSGVLANIIVGAFLIFHVWRYRGHPFVEALSLLWGVIMFLLDFVHYTVSDIFDHRGDFDKIYVVYPWSKSVFIFVDIMMVLLILFLLTRKEFWKGIQLPRKPLPSLTAPR